MNESHRRFTNRTENLHRFAVVDTSRLPRNDCIIHTHPGDSAVENKEQPATQPVEPTKGRSSPPSQLFTLLFVVGVLAVGVLAVGVYAFPSFLVKEVKPPHNDNIKTGATS